MTEPVKHRENASTAITQPLKPTTNKFIPIEDLIQFSTDNPNLTLEQIGKQFGVTKHTVWARFKHHGFTMQRLKNWKKNRANVFDFYTSKILNAVTPGDIKKAPLQAKIIAAGILYDKMRLETGQSTGILSVTNKDIADHEARQARKVELLKAARLYEVIKE